MKEIQQLRTIVDSLETDSKEIGQFKGIYIKLDSALTQLESAKAEIERSSKTSESFVTQSQDRFIDILKSLNALKDATVELQNLKTVVSSEIAGLEQNLSNNISEQINQLNAKTESVFDTLSDDYRKSNDRLSNLLYTSITLSILSIAGIGLCLYQFFK